MRMLVRSIALGVVLAVVPLAASAAGDSPALPTPPQSGAVMLVTVGAVLALFLVATMGWLYEQRRGLHWRFQDPDAPRDHGAGH